MSTISDTFELAIQHHQAGRLEAAEQIYRQILALQPDHAGAWHLLGLVAYQAGKQPLAVQYIEYAIRLSADVAAFHSNLGLAYRALGRLDDAAACWRRAVELEPNFAAAHGNLGNVLQELGRPDQAVACHRRALELRPDFAEAHYNLGSALKDQGKLDEAIACYRRALELNPQYVEAYNNLGIACKDQGKLDEAVACFRRALELKPGYAEAQLNMGNHFLRQAKLDDALACYNRSVELKPDYAQAHWNRSLTWLLAGDWQRGWPEYEWRWQTKGFSPRRFPQPLWRGEPLAGKTILLHAEQGLGDTIQFIRYAPIVRRRGGRVVVECHKLLLGLLEGCPGVDQLVEQGEELPAFDYYAPLVSVPGILKTTPETIPASIPYLFVKPAILESWRNRLAEFGGFKIGIGWQGNPLHANDRFRSIPLGFFEPLAHLPEVRLFSLQRGPGVEQLQELGDRFPVADLGSRLGDFLDAAAVMMNLDLVIACDTAPVHLAGALGVPVWVALPLSPDWRWLLDRSDSPWYPTMRLFRQKELCDWAGVFEEMRAALCRRLGLPA